MDELVEWLRTQLDEDERVAREAAHYEAGNWTTEDGYPVSVADELPEQADTFERVVVFDEGSPSEEQARHIARHDPARVLREVDAKRRLLDLHQPTMNPGRDSDDDDPATWLPVCSTCQVEIARPGDWPCEHLRLLALPYADRPGYREEWRP
ncbi:DUF6221 family protein [Streptomyces sp. enrichment culture]|uniref:DUF6221 family protein n=1 Tax=Streptomyces sp. enrichment culture TaxID=1795815 RepID=UPI003F57B39C